MSDRHKHKPFPLRMDDDLRAWVKQKSEEESRSQNGTIVHRLKELMQHEQKAAQ